MRIVAGIDVGNATTEVVLGRVGPGAVDGAGVEVLAAERAPTRREKGSQESIAGAAALVRRLERRHDLRVETAVVAPLRPVRTLTATLPEEAVDTGRLRVLRAGSATAGGHGAGAGRPVRFGSTPPPTGPVVLVVPSGTGYAAAAAKARELAAAGRLAGVVLADDEAVLVSNRLVASRPRELVPVVDQVEIDAVVACSVVAVEVAAPGRPLRALTDPLRLAGLLAQSGSPAPGPDVTQDAARLAGLLSDVSSAVVGVVADNEPRPAVELAWVELRSGERVPVVAGRPLPGLERVGGVASYALPPDLVRIAVDDLFAVDLGEVATSVRARRGAAAARPLGLASLTAEPPVLPDRALGEALGVPVSAVATEARAARAGALTTPGAPDHAVVVDLGGGTLDVVTPDDEVVAAGAGDLLTRSVAALTEVTTAAAEWVKRGPANRVEAPQVLLAEDGSRQFLDHPLGPDAVGRLVVPGPAGWLPVTDRLAPGEWRALRLALKVACLGGNLARALRDLAVTDAPVLLVGGPVGDDEVLAAVTAALPADTVVARGDVAGRLGHRYAVARGLLSLG